jgi:thioredoxin-related protein
MGKRIRPDDYRTTERECLIPHVHRPVLTSNGVTQHVRFSCSIAAMRTLMILLAALCASLPVGAQPVLRALPPAVQLPQDGALSSASQRPVILFFTLPGCSYCRIVRHDYLIPMMRGLREDEQPLIREVSVTGDRWLTNFDGQRLTESELARRYKVAMTPTLLLVNAQGELLSEPLLGGDHPNYVALLTRMITDASQKMGGKRVRLRGSDHRE